MMTAAWPAGRYPIRVHRHGVAPPAEDRPWGYAVKAPGGMVRIEPVDEPAMGG